MKLTVPENRAFLIMVIILAVLSVYSFMLNGQFKSMDDDASIVRNVEVRSFDHIGQIMTSSYFKRKVYYRPLVMLTYMLEYRAFGLNAYFYYCTNIAVHAANALLVFFIVLALLRRQGVAFCAALLFAVHPLQWEAVCNIPGRSILLATFFTLGAFLLFVRARERRWMIVLSVLSFILALLSKESASMLLPILFSYQYFFKRGQNTRLMQWTAPLFVFAAVLLFYVFLRKSFGITELYTWRNVSEAVLGFSTFLRGTITYLRLFILPVDMHFDRGHALYQSFLDINIILTYVFYAAAAGLTFKFRKRIPREAAFFLSWVLIDMIPVSQFWVTIGLQPGWLSMAEHFLYGASIGVFVLLCLAVCCFHDLNKRRRVVSEHFFVSAVACLYIFFCLVTVQNAYYARSEISMFKRTLHFNPYNSRIRYNLGLAYAKVKRFQEAESEFRKSLELTPEALRVRIALGKALSDQGKLWEGLQEYEKIDFAYDDEPVLRGNIKANYDLLEKKYTDRLTTDPHNAQLYYSLGVVYFKQDLLAKAREAFVRSLELKPEYADAAFNLGITYEREGARDKAAALYRQVIGTSDAGSSVAAQAEAGLKRLKVHF